MGKKVDGTKAKSRLTAGLAIGDIVIVEARDLNVEGQGVAIAVAESKLGDTTAKASSPITPTIFVSGLLPTERARVKIIAVKRNYAVAKIIKLLKASTYRVVEPCPVARQCGGCNLQHVNYNQQLVFKQAQVYNALHRIGKISCDLLDKLVQPTLGMVADQMKPWFYRSKVQMRWAMVEGIPTYGYYVSGSHDLVGASDCRLQPVIVEEVMQTIKHYCQKYKVKLYDENSGQGYLRHVMVRLGMATKQLMVVLVVNKQQLPPQTETLIADLELAAIKFGFALTSLQLNYNLQATNLILGTKSLVIYGQSFIEEEILGLRYRISPLSFFQVNPEQTAVLYREVLRVADLQAESLVWDLYCGTGSISLLLAQRAKEVLGIEIIPEAIADAKVNAENNGLSAKCRFLCGKAEVLGPQLVAQGEAVPDVVVLDPPRKGCEPELLQAVLAVKPKKIVYVSCSAASLARDLHLLLAGKEYELQVVQPVDMFPQTMHVETVVLLSKLDSKKYISVELPMDDMDLTSSESKATYKQIQNYVLEKFGFKVSTLYIAQVKKKYGLEIREHYNISKNENQKVSQCPIEKEEAIENALEYFGMI